MTVVRLTRRALLDLEQIRSYSRATWSPAVARRYESDLQSALVRLGEHPGILGAPSEISDVLHLHRVREHVLVCTVVGDVLYLVAVLHCSMDLPSRLTTLEPTLVAEVRLMHAKLERG